MACCCLVQMMPHHPAPCPSAWWQFLLTSRSAGGRHAPHTTRTLPTTLLPVTTWWYIPTAGGLLLSINEVDNPWLIPPWWGMVSRPWWGSRVGDGHSGTYKQEAAPLHHCCCSANPGHRTDTLNSTHTMPRKQHHNIHHQLTTSEQHHTIFKWVTIRYYIQNHFIFIIAICLQNQ